MTRTFGSAVAVSFAAVLAGVIALTPVPVAVRVLVALPLVLLLPGLVLTAVIFGGPTRWIERLPVALALSIATCIVGGFALNWTVGITKASWTAFLVVVTVAGAFLAQRHGRFGHDSIENLSTRLRAARIPVRGVVLALPALALVVIAVGLARSALPAHGVRGYTALWLLPAQAAPGAVQIGVSSSELRTTSYWLELRAGGRSVLARPLTLKTGEEWQGVVDASSLPVARRSFEARLYRLDQPQTSYRRVTLLLPGATVPPTTALWLVPGPQKTNTVRVLVTSAELRRTSFWVELRAGDRLVDSSLVTLRPGQRTVVVVDVSSIPRSKRSFEALLYLQGASLRSAPYRSARLVDEG